MSLRTTMLADLPTFVNPNEFGEALNINGVSVCGVLTGDEGQTQEGQVGAGDGLYRQMRVLTIPQSTLASIPLLPIVDKSLTIGGEEFVVRKVDLDEGMYALMLENVSGGPWLTAGGQFS